MYAATFVCLVAFCSIWFRIDPHAAHTCALMQAGSTILPFSSCSYICSDAGWFLRRLIREHSHRSLDIRCSDALLLAKPTAVYPQDVCDIEHTKSLVTSTSDILASMRMLAAEVDRSWLHPERLASQHVAGAACTM